MNANLKATEQSVNQLIDSLKALKTEIRKVIVGQEDTVDQLLITFLAGGHALLEGVPGLAKTLMIRTLSEAVHLKFRRIQFTPDLMPSDIIGTEILEEDHTTGKRIFKFNKGPLFANIILADEINRTSPKTQSALLEAMRSLKLPMAALHIRSNDRSSSSLPRTPSNRQEHSRCPKHSSTVSFCTSGSVIPLPKKKEAFLRIPPAKDRQRSKRS